MPTSTTPRGVKARKVSVPLAVKKRRTVKNAAGTSRTSNGDEALLIARFAEALGHAAPRKARSKRRSLSQALEASQSARPFSATAFIDIMPGVRVAERPAPSGMGASDRPLAPPCAAVHRRNKVKLWFRSAAAWGLATLVIAVIVSASAAGLLAQAPDKIRTHIATASAAQF